MANNIIFKKGKIKFNKKSASFTIPIGVAKQLYDKPEGKQDVFVTVTGNVIQLSIKVPDCVIPVMVLEPKQWIPQKA